MFRNGVSFTIDRIGDDERSTNGPPDIAAGTGTERVLMVNSVDTDRE